MSKNKSSTKIMNSAKRQKLAPTSAALPKYADPTYDNTFKMLFADDKENKDIIISLLNNLLNFEEEQKIIDLTINPPDLQKESASGVKGAVDVLCTTLAGKKIAVEMQRQYKDYFLPRTQEYMSKIISNQVMSGQSQLYHEVLMETYVLAIGKQNMFRGKYEIDKADHLFEKTVVPMIKELNIEMPGNVMHWKFYELTRFTREYKNVNIGLAQPLKIQWLDFLVNCHKRTEKPEDVNEIIKKGYNIMETANWTADQRTLYWKQQADEASEIAEAARLQEESKHQGLQQGLKQGKIEEQIMLLKNALEANTPHELLSSIFKSVPEENLLKVESFFKEHPDANLEQFAELMGLSAISSDAYDISNDA